MNLESILAQLTPLEQSVILPFVRADATDLVAEHRQEGDTVWVELKSRSGFHCAFQIVFCREPARSNVSIFVGLGGELCNYEPIDTAVDAADFGADMELWGSHAIVCTEVQGGVVVDARYEVVQSEPLKLAVSYGGPHGKGPVERRTSEYVPWFVAQSGSNSGLL